jgi:phage shock protein C
MKKRIYRSRKEKLVGGVCGGISNYFDVDPVLIRLIFLALLLIGGYTVLAYIIAWIIIPNEPKLEPKKEIKVEKVKAEVTE